MFCKAENSIAFRDNITMIYDLPYSLKLKFNSLVFIALKKSFL